MSRLQLGFAETATSLISRLAAYYGAKSAELFCIDIGLSYRWIVLGHRDAVQKLADFAEVDGEALAKHTAERIDTRNFSLFSETFAIFNSPRTTIRICPACMRNEQAALARDPDSAMSFSSFAQISSIRCCPRHKIEYVTIARSDRSHLGHDFALRAATALWEFEQVPEVHILDEQNQLQAYLEGRFGRGNTSDALIDSINMTALEPALLRVGALAVFGKDARPLELNHVDAWRAREEGLRVLAGGHDALVDLIRRAQSRLDGGQSVFLTPQKSMGSLYRWLSHYAAHADFSPLRRAFAHAIFETFALPNNAVILGEPIGTRRFKTLGEIALDRQFRIKPSNAAKFAVDHNCFAAGSDVLIPVERVHEIIKTERYFRQPEDRIRPAEIQKRLGISFRLVAELAQHGILPEGIKARADGNVVWYPRSETDGGIAELFSAMTAVGVIPKGFMTIRGACRALRCTLPEMLARIRGGEIREAVYLTGFYHLKHVYLPPVTPSPPPPLPEVDEPYLSTKQVMSRLGVGALTVSRLVRAGILVGEKYFAGKAARYRFAEADIRRFENSYRTSEQIIGQMGVSSRKRIERLEQIGMRPALLASEYGTAFFHTGTLALR